MSMYTFGGKEVGPMAGQIFRSNPQGNENGRLTLGNH